MWRRALLILFFVVNGLCASKNNEEVFRKLCRIAGNVSALMGQENREAKEALREALYGSGLNGQARFNDDGTFNGWCGLGMHSRSECCSHIQRGLQHIGESGKHGCFGHSLLGTFLCICVPGQDRQDLCGLGIEKSGMVWGGWHAPPEGLLQKVWEKIKENCTARRPSACTSAHLEKLANTVEGIKEDTEKNKISGNSGYYLGGSKTTGHCGGVHPQYGCVTYPPQTDKGEEAHIPWADKILTGVQKLKYAINQQQKNSISPTTGAAHQKDPVDDLSDDAPGDDEQVEEESEEESAQNPGSHNNSKTPRPRRKRRSTKKPPTNQHAESLKAILHHEDGTLLTTATLWLFGAVLFF